MPHQLSRRHLAKLAGGAAILTLGACARNPSTTSAGAPKAGGMANTATSAAAADPFQVLMDDHRKIAALLTQAISTSDAGTRTQLLEQIQEALLVHDVAEGMAVYPAMRQAAMAGEARQLNDEHGDIKTTLYQLAQMPKEGAAWTDAMTRLQRIITRHVGEEENRAFPALRQAMAPDQLRNLAVAMQKARAEVA